MSIIHRRSVLCQVALVLVAAGCGGDGAVPPVPSPAVASTFDRIQTEVLDRQCVSCHTTGGSYAVESGLALEAGKSYAALVGVPGHAPTARADGLRRVMAFKADSSLLYHKLAWATGHHARDYGLPMPMGTAEGISLGQLEYIRRWIEAGAPRTGEVADVALLADRVAQRAPVFSPLPRPRRACSSGSDSFAVRPQFERELFVYRRLGNPAELYVNRIETRMRREPSLPALRVRPDNRSLPVQPAPAGRPGARHPQRGREHEPARHAAHGLPRVRGRAP
jgi:hypothetical protein